MKHLWFKPWGWIHRPVSLIGWIVTLLPVLFIISVFLALDRSSHSVTDLLYPFFIYFMATATLWNWIAGHSSK
ncbi:MAG: hypothetical protein V1846_02450 [Candidatus Komeilibacteria bacterium]